MSFIHKDSCECAKSELDLFTSPMTQTAIENGVWTEYNPVSAINDGAPIEFFVGGSGTDYIDLANTQLFVRAQLLRGDGTPIDNTNRVAPVNLFLHSLFGEVDLKLNDSLVSSANNMYAYRAYIETLLSYGSDAKRSQLTASLYYKDEGGAVGFEEGNPLDANATNHGMVTRHSFFSNGNTVDMLGCIHSDLFFQEKYLPSDVGMRLRFARNKDAFCLMSDQQNPQYKVKIVDCKLFVRKVHISPSVFVAQAKAFEVGNAKYAIRRVVCKSYTIAAGARDNTHENLFTGQLPSRLVIGMVRNASYNGVYGHNPYNFHHYSVSHVKVLLDGQSQHVKTIECNFADHQTICAYMSLFSGSNKWRRDEGNEINRRDYEGGYTLFCYDLSPDLSEETHFNLAREGNVRIDLKFEVALPHTINVVVYAEFESIVQIDRNKNILIDYTN